jgi:hypothetical protein
MARNVLTIARTLGRSAPIEAVALVWDADTQADAMRRGLDQARATQGWPFRHVLALAVRSREAWVLAGFEPQKDDERDCLEEHRREVGYSPVEHAHRLDSKNQAKNVLADLTREDRGRERRCWQEPPLDRLQRRGVQSGLRAFLEDVGRELVPLVHASRPPTRFER